MTYQKKSRLSDEVLAWLGQFRDHLPNNAVMHLQILCNKEAEQLELTQEERIRLIATLTISKVEMLKLKADHYNWNAMMSEELREQILETLKKIDDQLLVLKTNKATDI